MYTSRMASPKVRACFALILAAVMLSGVGCSDSTLQKVAKAELDISAGCSTTFTAVSAAQTSGLISTADATTIMQVLLKVEQADQQAETATSALTTLNATGSASLLADIQPVQTALSNLVASGLTGIKDANTKTAVLAGLTLVTTAIATAVALLQAVKS